MAGFASGVLSFSLAAPIDVVAKMVDRADYHARPVGLTFILTPMPNCSVTRFISKASGCYVSFGVRSDGIEHGIECSRRRD